MRVLIVGNEGDDDAGVVLDWLVRRGASVDRLVREQFVEWPRPDAALDQIDLLVSLGSDWSVYAQHVADPVGREIDLLSVADQTGVATLGICFGGQLLAAAHGATVSAIDRPEIGWCDVESTDEALVPSGRWAQWHLDGFVAPEGANLIASSPSGAQAFAYGRSLGLQFHPEVNESIMLRWAAGDESAAQMERVGITHEELRAQCRSNAVSNVERTNRLLSEFASRVSLPIG